MLTSNFLTLCSALGSRDGAVLGALTSHQCGLGSIPRLGVRCGLSLLLVLFLAPRGFSVGTPVLSSPQKPTFLNSNSIWTQWSESHPVDVPLLIPIYLLFIYHYMTDYKFLFNTVGVGSHPTIKDRVTWDLGFDS